MTRFSTWLLTLLAVVLVSPASAQFKARTYEAPKIVPSQQQPAKASCIALPLDTDRDGVPNAKDSDDDNDGLSDVEELQLGTDPLRADTDGDGYTDYQEVTDVRLRRPPADYKTKGKRGCDPLRKDVVIELDYLGPKKRWFVKYCGHEPGGEALRDMIDRFEENGFNVFICVDDEISHKRRDELDRQDVFTLRDRYRDTPVYYYCFYADEAGDELGKTGLHGVAWYHHNNFVVFDGVWYLFGDLVGATTMHELGHLLIDTYPENPDAAHLVSQPKVWNDGAHCPHDCIMNYFSKLSLREKASQWWEFDYCSDCWKAIRGFYDQP